MVANPARIQPSLPFQVAELPRPTQPGQFS